LSTEVWLKRYLVEVWHRLLWLKNDVFNDRCRCLYIFDWNWNISYTSSPHL
jgi:hypothetical protein